MAKKILIKPIITEKADALTQAGKYSFVVNKKANKVEIRKAVEELYSVSVDSVNTAILPGKAKSRNTKSGIVRGRIPGYKKAVVTLTKGEEINFFGDI